MLILKRLVVWLIERLVEALLLGVLLGYLAHIRLAYFYAYALAVLFVLYAHGYYFTTAFFGVLWRKSNTWFYAAIISLLFLIHAYIAFVRLQPSFTPEARVLKLPLLLFGASLVFACSYTGQRILNTWLNGGTRSNPYFPATLLTLFVFALANVAHFMRVTYSNAFRRDGLPFSFYRQGGFSDGYVWHNGNFYGLE